uniref:Uncharacterized protein n=1 Tax=Tanacetum cinerariifolium TaxID=118510 RepID=A0A6L2NV82_TANCI|nr:hypothetical protein [Tanacetum cinerariifolium]
MNKDNDDEDEGPNEDETYLARVASKLRSALLALAAHATDSTNFLQKEYAQWIVSKAKSEIFMKDRDCQNVVGVDQEEFET